MYGLVELVSGQEDASNSSELSDDYDKLSVKDSIKNRIESFDRVATIDAVIAAPGKFKSAKLGKAYSLRSIERSGIQDLTPQWVSSLA